MSFPVGDWQFWAVTASALGSLWMLVRPFLGARSKAAGGACSHCGVAAGAPCQGARGGDSGAGGRERLVVIGDGR